MPKLLDKRFKYPQEKQHTNVTVALLQYSAVTKFQKEINILATLLMHTRIVCAYISGNYFIRHGLHMNSDKEEIIEWWKQPGQLRGILQKLFQ
jgi:hypothetical protein